MENITAKELYEKLQKNNKVTLIDVRAEEKYKDFHIEHPLVESRNIPKSYIFGLEEEGESLTIPKNEEIVLACTTGNSATKCSNMLRERGYKATVLEGGVTAWKEFLISKEEGDRNQ